MYIHIYIYMLVAHTYRWEARARLTRVLDRFLSPSRSRALSSERVVLTRCDDEWCHQGGAPQ